MWEKSQLTIDLTDTATFAYVLLSFFQPSDTEHQPNAKGADPGCDVWFVMTSLQKCIHNLEAVEECAIKIAGFIYSNIHNSDYYNSRYTPAVRSVQMRKRNDARSVSDRKGQINYEQHTGDYAGDFLKEKQDFSCLSYVWLLASLALHKVKKTKRWGNSYHLS